MILLSFTVRNHRSIRDQLTLDLVKPSFRTLQPKDGDWASAAYPVAGIFGGNATGKSALLDALKYVQTAIRYTSTQWQDEPQMPRLPFALNGTAKTSSSTYELDFVHEGRRHFYFFEVDARGIVRESLQDIPTTRRRTLLVRTRDEGDGGRDVRTHSTIKGLGGVSDRELALSRAHVLRLPKLFEIAADLIEHLDFVLVSTTHREGRLRSIAESLGDGGITFADLEALLQVADIGVTKIGLEEREYPFDVRELSKAIAKLMRDRNGSAADENAVAPEDEDQSADLDEEESEAVIRSLVFKHRGSDPDSRPFSISEESDGTIAWLAIAVPALETLRQGGVLCVDEIDASLHPHLLDLLLGAFADPRINIKHAQIIFTSHESYVLSPLSETNLEPEQVWFTDKSADGATELSCLADFPRHSDANVARRYLTGRYGGTPRLSPSVFTRLVTQNSTDA
ncbi:AAA family ATPase [Pseudoclavibacter sp. AY1F1]|uniref:AAA family ATPase n=1 Tax=Pseudoclavibacter sp. AY1F1 TaxID=2080583 RepID=UPI000CE768FD|nr:AAA family ATPase [Pseudoclavibacter sp. AY1F1]PPF46730.1 AAA family ATPase [Pseudoclavibacter sp. AY1F1]